MAGVRRGRKEERRAREAREDRTREDRGRGRTQKLFIINWQAFSRQTFFRSKGSLKELQRFNEVREQI